MKKILFTMVACLAMVGSVYAQSNLVATLFHEGNLSFFYGPQALQLADNAAVDGDTITLSEGVFRNTTITHSITLRGTGMKRDSDHGIESTRIIELIIEDGISNVKLEGVDILSLQQGGKTNNDIYMIRCKIDLLRNISGKNWTFVNCILPDVVCNRSASTTYYYNCIVHNCIIYDFDDALHNYVNCVVITRGHDYERGCPAGMRYCTYKNSIICNELGWEKFPNTVSASYNVGIKQVYFDNVLDTATNQHIEDYSAIFTTYDGGAYSDEETFELTNEAATTYLGDDGTQVGIYGGEYPFNTILSYPQFTKATVAKKAVDGKLSVNIELNGGN